MSGFDRIKTCDCGEKIIFVDSIKKVGTQVPVVLSSLDNEDWELYNSGEILKFKSKVHINHFSNCPLYKKFKKGKSDGKKDN